MTSPVQQAVATSAAHIPSVDRLLSAPVFRTLLDTYGRTQLVGALRMHLDELRVQALAGGLASAAVSPAAIAHTIGGQLAAAAMPRLRPVYNLTGTVLHTNLGRALLPDSAVHAVVQALTSSANLEFDLDTGGRGDRDDLVEDLLCQLTGAEAATVVNNNAAAILLMLNTLGNKREVVVSRGELVEIGGAFRIPDIMQRAGSRLVEVGTTNRTHAADYENALGPRTAMLMKVHCSNYTLTGFTKSVPLAHMAAIARRHGVPATVDLGSGTLVDMTRWGLPREATVRETVNDGADIVTFSGDKLLGGPQAGLLVGRADLIKKIKKNPLKRVLRVGKLTLAALEPVLALYRAPEFLPERLTTLRLLTRPQHTMRAQAQRLQPIVQGAVGPQYIVRDMPMLSQIGSGAMPVDSLPSHGLSIRYDVSARPGRHLAKLEARLRRLPQPIIGRIADDALWLDLRCLEEHHEAAFMAQLSELSP
jgi:L-seryl-tRNA(Ser) seleniumtransferase